MSFAAPQLRLIWLLLTALPVNVPGADGGCASGATGVFMSLWICAADNATL